MTVVSTTWDPDDEGGASVDVAAGAGAAFVCSMKGSMLASVSTECNFCRKIMTKQPILTNTLHTK